MVRVRSSATSDAMAVARARSDGQAREISMSEEISVSHRNRIATITIDRPKQRNALAIAVKGGRVKRRWSKLGEWLVA